MARPAPSTSSSSARPPASATSTGMASNPPLPSEIPPAAESAPGGEVPRAALRPAWVAGDVTALEANLAEIRRRLAGSAAQAMAVVKADAYGHGAAGGSRGLQSAGVGSRRGAPP